MAHCRKLAEAVQKEMRRRLLKTLKKARDVVTRSRKLNREVKTSILFLSLFLFLSLSLCRQ
jgi:hypothetical protein